MSDDRLPTKNELERAWNAALEHAGDYNAEERYQAPGPMFDEWYDCVYKDAPGETGLTDGSF